MAGVAQAGVQAVAGGKERERVSEGLMVKTLLYVHAVMSS